MFAWFVVDMATGWELVFLKTVLTTATCLLCLGVDNYKLVLMED